MPPRTDIQLWLDLECTGAQDEDEIVEIGLVLTDSETLSEIDTYSHLVVPSTAGWARMEATAAVMTMHRKSGLYDDLARVRELRSSEYNIESVDDEVIEWLRSFTGTNSTHIPLGGSGVSHYDRKYIRRDMPKLDKRLTYWAYDVGSTRRQFQLFGVPWYSAPSDKEHRALSDARRHLDELRYVGEVLRKALPEI